MPGKRRSTPHRLRHLVRWWLGLFALWLLFAGQWSWLVAVWGACAALAAAVGAAALARWRPAPRRWRWRWSAELVPAAAAVVTDFGVLVWALARAVAGRRRRLGAFREDRSATGTDPRAAGRRTWVTLLATWSPNSYVLDIDPSTGRRRLHDLLPRAASERPA